MRPVAASPLAGHTPAPVTALSAIGLQKSYGTKVVLEDATLTVDVGERVGVVGRNGAGKSTFARILAGLETADGGEIRTRRGLTVGYLAQAPVFPSGRTAIEAVLDAHRRLPRPAQVGRVMGIRRR